MRPIISQTVICTRHAPSHTSVTTLSSRDSVAASAPRRPVRATLRSARVLAVDSRARRSPACSSVICPPNFARSIQASAACRSAWVTGVCSGLSRRFSTIPAFFEPLTCSLPVAINKN
jgi:hypothetical protein